MTQLLGKLFRLCLVIYVFTLAYEWWKPDPEFFAQPPPTYKVPENGVHFFADITFIDKKGMRQSEQQIWDELFATIGRAEHSILADMYLFNDFHGTLSESFRPLSQEFTEKLVSRKESDGHVAIALITDPVNTVYGGVRSPYIDRLERAGIPVIETDLKVLPDSNLLWSAFWRPFVSWWGNSADGGFFPHPFQYGGEKVSLRSWLAFMNTKANHRSLLVADEPLYKGKTLAGQKMVTLVTSANPHDAGSADHNVLLKVDDHLWKDALANETVVAKFSDAGLPLYNVGTVNDEDGALRVTLLREKWVKNKTLTLINTMHAGDSLDLFLFTLADRDIIKAVIAATKRNVRMRIILDPNKEEFGFPKNGIPNLPVARELLNKSGDDLMIRWCDTHGETCNSKFILGKSASSSFLLLGSADFTSRGSAGYNLVTDVLVEGENTAFPAWDDAQELFLRYWNNENGQFTTAYEQYRDTSWWKSSLYRMMERTHLNTF